MQRLAAGISARNVPAAVERARTAERLGYDSVWVNSITAERDSFIVLTAIALGTEKAGLGTFVVPIYSRHPTVMVQSAATLDELSGGRLRLGIGVSHKVVVENMWGLSLARPVEAMREYFTIVRTALDESSVNLEGKHFTARWAYQHPRPQHHLPILISALAPKMLELAGEVADGVALWMCSPRYIEETVIPHLRAGRERSGRNLDGFEVVAGVDVSLTTNVEGAREVARPRFSFYSNLPYYRRVVDEAGFKEDLARGEITDEMIHELAGIGDEKAIRQVLRRYRDAGCTLPLLGAFAGHAGAAGFEATLQAAAAS
jgi:F420-dependent oxidoreductase-like protein